MRVENFLRRLTACLINHDPSQFRVPPRYALNSQASLLKRKPLHCGGYLLFQSYSSKEPAEGFFARVLI